MVDDLAMPCPDFEDYYARETNILFLLSLVMNRFAASHRDSPKGGMNEIWTGGTSAAGKDCLALSSQRGLVSMTMAFIRWLTSHTLKPTVMDSQSYKCFHFYSFMFLSL